ncbi:MAG: membrane protein insertase YidC [Paludibacteraceae bacterium]|nr:membrane protein insertase YidC [Paludibacteraceae bacterium]
MDRSKIGWILIFVLLFGWMYLSMNENEKFMRAQQAYNDSIARVEQAEKKAAEAANLISPEEKAIMDSAAMAAKSAALGVFASAANGSEQTVELSNSVVKLVFSNKGACMKSATLLKYKTYDGNPLEFFRDGEMSFNMTFPMANGFNLNSSDLYFKVKSQTDNSVVFSLVGEASASLDFVYTLSDDSYMVDFDVVANNCSSVFKPVANIPLVWKNQRRQLEKGRVFEDRYTQMYYKDADDVDYLSESRTEQISVNNLKWVAFKGQFFSAVLISDKLMGQSMLQSEKLSDSTVYMKNYMANVQVPFDQSASFRYFIGPNWYKLLKSYDKDLSGDDKLQLKRIVPLGWGIFRWINQILTIPLFNFFGSFIGSMGIVILLLTIVVKSILFPLTYKSYLSSAMMKALKPEIDKINKQYEDDPQKRGQETMALYNRSGVNPLGGCLPMLLSMPILIALYCFFPSAIELRQQSFLWAEDLSSYDAIVTFPFSIPGIGDHLSLFCLLMTVTNLLYTKFNMSMTDTSGAYQQMPMMKYMMYLMPVWFFFMFNDYASGLCYYYFVSMLITVIQTIMIRRSIDDEALLLKIQSNMENPKKSSWMENFQKAMEEQHKMRESQGNMKK